MPHFITIISSKETVAKRDTISPSHLIIHKAEQRHLFHLTQTQVNCQPLLFFGIKFTNSIKEQKSSMAANSKIPSLWHHNWNTLVPNHKRTFSSPIKKHKHFFHHADSAVGRVQRFCWKYYKNSMTDLCLWLAKSSPFAVLKTSISTKDCTKGPASTAGILCRHF